MVTDYICGLSGVQISVQDPQPENFILTDIVSGLSRAPRFAGQLPRFYSVAQHSVLVSRYVPKELALRALLHDAHEAYLCDLPTPIKQYCPGYNVIAERFQNAINKRFEIPVDPEADEEVARMDFLVMLTEARQFIPGHSWHQSIGDKPLPIKIAPLPEAEARHIFLEKFHRYTR